MINQTYLRGFNYAALDFLIDRYKLHHSYPVSVEVLLDELNINRRRMRLPEGCDGFSSMHSRQGFGIAVFDERLEGARLAEVKFHELGHLLLHQQGRVHGAMTKGVLKGEELEADIVGCYLAAPATAVLEYFKAGLTAPQVAQVLGITPAMLQLRVEIMFARNELGVCDHPIFIHL